MAEPSEAQQPPASKRESHLYVYIAVAMLAGVVVGPLLGARAAPLGEIGKLVIQLIKTVATPLLFFAILNAILKTEVGAGAGVRMVFVAGVNGVVAILFGLTISNVLQPGLYLAEVASAGGDASKYADKKVDLLKTLTSYVPADLVTPFAQNLVLSIILIALLLGFGLRRARAELEEGGPSFRPIEDAIAAILRTMEIVLGWVIKLIPFAVFGVVAKTVGEHGLAPLKGLASYVVVGLLGLALHVAITYQLWIVLVAGIPLRRFWRIAREPVVYAMGTNSSLATLPVTLKALDRLGVSRSSSALGACVGTNLNNDGIVLYEGMAVLFVAQAVGIDLSLPQQVIAALTCMVAAMGVAGVPEAGFISLALVLNTVGLPVEILPLLLTVDWVIARARSMTNVLADMVLSIVIDRLGGAKFTEPLGES